MREGARLMKKKHPKKRAQPARPQTRAARPGPDANGSLKRLSRRDALRRVRDWGALGLIGGGGVYYLANSVVVQAAEADLSKLGNGRPTIVQIHDPTCPRCQALQREARAALGALDDDRLQYLVANIRTSEGGAFARAHGAGHETLLLFDGEGALRETLVGERSREALEAVFARLAGAG